MAATTFEMAAELLGGRKVLGDLPKDPVATVALIRRGFPVRSLKNLRQMMGLSLPELAEALNLSVRTLERRTAKESTHARLSETESERVYRFARVVARACDVLGDREKAYRWLRKENRALGGEKPIMLLATDVGTTAVEDALTRIEYGVLS